MHKKDEINQLLNNIESNIEAKFNTQTKFVSLLEYKNLVYSSQGKEIWTKALQIAINENDAVYIPAAKKAYYIDSTIIIPSNRVIKADKKTRICQTRGTKVLLLRNENTVDGTHEMPNKDNRDQNIAIIGGIWEESNNCRMGYGKSGMYDLERSYYGVSTCMLFNNIENLYLKDVTFKHTAGFAVQIGEITNAVLKDIKFVNCFADGLHINGNSENLVIKNIKGKVGDDLVALNMYDWLDSSVNFGPMKNIICENLKLSKSSPYKAMRIEPGMYYFKDGSSVDCSINNLIVKNVRGIDTFKIYFQTPAYKIGEAPEKGGVGSGDNIFFEDIKINMKRPIDYLPVYVNSDEIRGNFGAFELGANIKNIYFENIKAHINNKKFPLAGLISVGPKSNMNNGIEVFDPYLSSAVDNIHYKNIFINNNYVEDIKPYVKISSFDNINQDNNSTACGVVNNYTSKVE